jgi:uncharacterized protein (TIGR03435 family)
VPAVLTAQDASLRFDVASVKPDPKQDRGGPQKLGEFTLSTVQVLPGGRVESVGRMLRHLIGWAYDINTAPQRVVGEQDILEMEFNISAKAAAESLTVQEARAMLRTLLEERFQLRWRLQPREVDGYLMMPSRDDGLPARGLRPFTGDCEARAGNPAVRFENPEYEQQRRCGWSGINGRYRAVGLSMTALAQHMTNAFMGAPVLDRTGWPGLFTFDIMANTDDMPMIVEMRARTGGRPAGTDAPPMLEVFRTELGLKLVKERTTITDLVVERVGPFIEN